MGDISARLATLIGSRICHDLISPIGAISNGLELLDLAGSATGPEFELISDSVLNAGARIRFFRIAYGAAGDQMLGRPEISSILNDMGRAGRLQMRWTPTDPQPRSEARLAFLALQCCESAMPYGGTIEVARDGDAWTVTGQGEKVVHNAEVWSNLASSASVNEITPALVQFALLPRVAADLDRTVSYRHTPERITIRF